MSQHLFYKRWSWCTLLRNNMLMVKKGKWRKAILKNIKSNFSWWQWEKRVVNFTFNSNEYSVAHPALSPDDKTRLWPQDTPGFRSIRSIQSCTNGDIMENQKTLDLCLIQKLENFPFMSDEKRIAFCSDAQQGLED
jgi:hypothetical protein